ncbi:hypothetical protein NKH33_07785 [Mesorhizobium sp. M1182]|uniref:hypothetical protein n=1 Tax=Mesorhizobium sp. M1182 TaxID=2957067 RepID=UPI00333B9B6B
MTPAQKDLARHALGLPNRQRRSYRNHFVTGSGGNDHREWMALVEAGHAWRRAGSELTGGSDLFRLTRAGAELVLEKRESLDPEAFPAVSP